MLKHLIVTTFLIISIPTFANIMPKIQHWTTDNGTKVLFVQTHELPTLDIQIIFDVGSARDDENYGIAQFTSAMLNKGSKTLTEEDIATKLDNIGVELGIITTRDMTAINMRSLSDPKTLNKSIKIFEEILTQPTFPNKAFERVKKQILISFTQEKEYPEIIAHKTFYKTLYENHPYGHSVLGSPKTIKKLKPADLKNFYTKYYVSKNAVIAIVGDINLKQAKNITNDISSKLKQGENSPKIPDATKTKEPKSKHINFPSKQTHIYIGQIGIDFDEPDFFPLLIGNYILGQSPFTSELFEEIRNKRGLAYHVSSNFIPLNAKGPFLILMQTRNNKTQESITITQQTLEKFIKEGPTKKQLLMSKKSLIGRFPISVSSNSKILALLSIIGFYDLPLDYLDTYQNKIEKVTLKQIKEALTNHINPDKMITITVGAVTNI